MKRLSFVLTAILLFFILPGCSSFKRPVQKIKFQEEVKKNSVLFVIDHLNKHFPVEKKLYVGVKEKAFENGSQVEVAFHEVLYWGKPSPRAKPQEHLVKARFGIKEKVASRPKLQRERGKIRRPQEKTVLLNYIFKEAPRSDSKVQIQFIQGYPSRQLLSETDPLKEFRKTQWIAKLRQRKVARGMPEKAVKLSWGEPSTVRSQTYLNSHIQFYSYGQAQVVIENGFVKNWDRPGRK